MLWMKKNISEYLNFWKKDGKVLHNIVDEILVNQVLEE